jgi:Immunity protein 50
MWNQNVEDDTSLRSIYGDAIPPLHNVLLHDIKIVYGAELSCFIRFDLAVMPKIIPDKWKRKGVNTVQLILALISAEVVHFYSAGVDMVGDIEIEKAGESKKISFRAIGNIVFEIRAKWMMINSISGYTKESVKTERSSGKAE